MFVPVYCMMVLCSMAWRHIRNRTEYTVLVCFVIFAVNLGLVYRFWRLQQIRQLCAQFPLLLQVQHTYVKPVDRRRKRRKDFR
jgi:hypothetical protein